MSARGPGVSRSAGLATLSYGVLPGYFRRDSHRLSGVTEEIGAVVGYGRSDLGPARDGSAARGAAFRLRGVAKATVLKHNS